MQKLRPYTPSDLPRVLQFAGECFRDRNFSNFHPGDIVHWMSNRYRGRDLDQHFWLFEQQNQLIAVAELSRAKSANFTLFTHPSCDPDLELGLFAECQSMMGQRMKENPADKQTLSTNIAAFDHSAITCLKSLGYELKPASEAVNIRPLDIPIPEPVLPEGFKLRSVASEHEAQLVAEVHQGAFGGPWTAEEYLKVVRTPGFSMERELVAVAPDGRFAAFLIYWLDPISKSGLFEPVGCHKDFQRRGLTKALMFEGMRRMVDGGMEQAIVVSEDDNLASNRLYASVGFLEHFKPLECEIYLGNQA